MSDAEIITILVLFHMMGYRCLKHFYLNHVCVHMSDLFPNTVSYSRFVELQQSVMLPLTIFVKEVLLGQCSMGWFFGFKLHLICNDKGELLNFVFTPANTDDREPLSYENFMKNVKGKLVGDKGYISKKLFEKLFVDGIQLITKIKKNMKNCLMSSADKILLHTVISQRNHQFESKPKCLIN